MSGVLDLLDQLDDELAAARRSVNETDRLRRLANAAAVAAEIRRRLDRDITGEIEKLKR